MAGTADGASADTWGTAALVPGSTVLNRGGLANVNSISCTAPGDCAAAGSYADRSFHNQALVADEQDGRWRTAREVPGTAKLNESSANALSVSCASAGNCAVAAPTKRPTKSARHVASENGPPRGTRHRRRGAGGFYSDGPFTVDDGRVGSRALAGALDVVR